jgi:hypothetical protein
MVDQTIFCDKPAHPRWKRHDCGRNVTIEVLGSDYKRPWGDSDALFQPA